MFALLPLFGQANTKTTVTQVTGTVTLSDQVDYVVTSDQPFADDGIVDITNTEHAVLILNKVKPSKVGSILSHVKINGAKATNNVNCQVRIYNTGSMILPYASSMKPLTVFSEKDFRGVAVSDFGLENSGGFMNTLSDEKLNNRIKSFKLKRGYMVTFSTQPRGRGYSRCFIAADADLEFAELPEILSGRITSYRIFKWNYNSKSGLANDTRSTPCSLLNVTSCYSFGLGEDRGVDTECVPHHIYEDWPSASACGSVTYSPHMKTNNEPGNSADDHPQSVDDILNNWENLMATGMRLCSPSSHDGSLNHLRAFMDSIDARGWRCDIIDLHCYWPEGSFNNIKGSWVDTYKRPIWISEWVWGASWNNNGIFGVATGNNRDNPTASQLNQNKTAVQNICSRLNSWDYIERYFYWNSEANCSKLYMNGALTPAGEYYASMNTGVGYNGKYEFIPTSPRQYGLSNFSMTYNEGKAVVRWRDQNGEYNQLMEVQRKTRGGQWEVLASVTPKETASNYTYTDENAPEGALYRVHIIDLNGVSHFTNDDIEAGDAVTNSDGTALYAGGNLIANGDFDLGMSGWTAGNGTPIASPYFMVAPGGYGGGKYLQAFGSGGIDHVSSLRKAVTIEANSDYLFTVTTRNAGSYIKIALSEDGKSETKGLATAQKTTDWQKQTFTFNSGEYTTFLAAFRWLSATAQIDKVELRRLFANRADAVADGVAVAKANASELKAYNTMLPALNEELDRTLAGITTADDDALYQAETALADVLEAISAKATVDSLARVAEAVKAMDFAGKETLEETLQTAKDSQTAKGIIAAREQLQTALDAFLELTDAPQQPNQPSFANAIGWETKVGTYTGGDQRTNTVKGKTCWNAWWSGLSASEGKARSMEVRQQIDQLDEGLYALECKATTEHYCLSDQHGYIISGDEAATTPVLQADYFDLPTIGNIWQTLTTTPVYVTEGGSVTIGFVGTKDGATDNAWHRFGDANNTGDKREGWWCATDFVLKYHPLKKMTAEVGKWTTLCLPYAYRSPEGATLYRVAGILNDHSKVCLEEIAQTQAGEPCILLADRQDLTLFEYGEKASSPVDYSEAGNLRGFFTTSVKAPRNTYVLTDGKWVKVGATRPSIDNYTAILYTLDGLQEFASWEGATIDIVDPDGISHVTMSQQAGAPVERYTLGGQSIDTPSGIYIEVKDKKARKLIKK